MCKAQLQKTHRRILVVCSHQLKSFKSPCGHQCLFDNSIYMAEQLWKSNRTVAMKKAFTPVPLLRACHDMFCFQFHLTIQWTKDPWRNMPWKMICQTRSPRPRGPSWQSFCNSLPICPSIHKVLWQLFSTRQDLHSSNHQKEARLQLLDDCHGGALGPLIQEANLVKDDGTTTTMFFANLLVYMMAIYNHNGAWTQLVQQSHAFCPSSIDNPWGLILYCDEII